MIRIINMEINYQVLPTIFNLFSINGMQSRSLLVIIKLMTQIMVFNNNNDYINEFYKNNNNIVPTVQFINIIIILWHSLIIWINNNIYYISNDAKYSINNSNEYILINYGNNINKGIPIDYQSINFYYISMESLVL